MTLSKDEITGVLKISGTLDIDGADELRAALLGALLDSYVHQSEVAADLSEVDRCDAAALQVLLAGRQPEASRKTLRFIAPSPAVTEIAAALGFLTVESGAGQGSHPHAE